MKILNENFLKVESEFLSSKKEKPTEVYFRLATEDGFSDEHHGEKVYIKFHGDLAYTPRAIAECLTVLNSRGKNNEIIESFLDQWDKEHKTEYLCPKKHGYISEPGGEEKWFEKRTNRKKVNAA